MMLGIVPFGQNAVASCKVYLPSIEGRYTLFITYKVCMLKKLGSRPRDMMPFEYRFFRITYSL